MESIQVSSTIKSVSLSPRKVSLVAALVRGRTVADALVILDHTPKRAAKSVQKAVASAKANAINNHKADEKSLAIEHITVTAGPRLKRFRPAARGRALPFEKKSSHIRVVLQAQQKPKKVAAKPVADTGSTDVKTEGKKG